MVGYSMQKINYKMADGGHLQICSIWNNSVTVRGTGFKFHEMIDLDVGNEILRF